MTSQVTPTHAQKLLQAIQHDIQISGQLLALLKQEKQALERRDYSDYHPIIETKKKHLQELEMADRKRRDLMAEMGFSADSEGLNAFLAHIPVAWRGRFEGAWNQLMGNLQTCRHQNEVNGRILNHAQQAIERLMSYLRGVSPNQAIYTKTGRKGLLASNRSLAMA
jgi:flagella synthesis protein FlgN